MIRVLVISGICLYRAGLADMLGRTGRIAVVGAAASVAEGVELCRSLTEPSDVILLDTIPADAELRDPRAERGAAGRAGAGADGAEQGSPSPRRCGGRDRGVT